MADSDLPGGGETFSELLGEKTKVRSSTCPECTDVINYRFERNRTEEKEDATEQTTLITDGGKDTEVYHEALESVDLRFAFRLIGSLIRYGVYEQFPDECPDCGEDTWVTHGGDRVRCIDMTDCGWMETRCHDCGVTPHSMFTYNVGGDLLNPPCVSKRGLPQ